MNYAKKVGMSLLIIFIGIIILNLLLTTFSYFNLLKEKTISVIQMIIPILSLLVGGIYFGLKANKKGWIEGLKLGLIFFVIHLIINLFLKTHIDIKFIFYDVILVTSCMIGSMIGINFKKKTD